MKEKKPAMTVLLPTTPEVSIVCDEIDNAIAAFLDARDTIPTLGRWESEVEALNVLYLGIRDVEAVLTLARTDLVLLAPAMMIARGALEASVKAMWMVGPEDPFQRECRWLVHLRAEERFWKRTSERATRVGTMVPEAQSRARLIREFADAVENKLPNTARRIERTPSFEEMLRSSGQADMYATYIHLSQFAHAEHAATWHFRTTGLGNAKKLEEGVKVSGWKLPLEVSWRSIVGAGRFLLQGLGGNARFLTNADEARVISAIERVGAARG